MEYFLTLPQAIIRFFSSQITRQLSVENVIPDIWDLNISYEASTSVGGWIVNNISKNHDSNDNEMQFNFLKRCHQFCPPGLVLLT